MFVVDIVHEHLAVAEANKLGIRTFGVVDTNGDPNMVDYVVPANDDAGKSVEIIVRYLADAVKQGLAERESAKTEKESSTASA